MALAANEFGSDSAKSTSRSSSMATWDEGTDTVGRGLGLGLGLGLGSCNGGGNWISLKKKFGNYFLCYTYVRRNIVSESICRRLITNARCRYYLGKVITHVAYLMRTRKLHVIIFSYG